MREILGNQLPNFTTAEIKFMKDNIDYIAVNHYSTTYAKDCIHSSCSLTVVRPINGFVEKVKEQNGVQIDRHSIIARSSKRPERSETIYLKRPQGNDVKISYSEPNTPELLQEALQDVKRIEFHKMYPSSLAQAIRKGADVKGYFVWTLMGDFEWING
nr:beta-glucosidase 18-like [Tanacetum cinerariifolium]